MIFSWSSNLLMCFSVVTLTSIIRIDLPILVELVDLVNSVIIFSNDLTQMINFPIQIPGCDFHSPALLDYFFLLMLVLVHRKKLTNVVIWKMQQNPWYGESLGNWYSYFSHGIGGFSPYDSHSMVYFITWEMHVFSH